MKTIYVEYIKRVFDFVGALFLLPFVLFIIMLAGIGIYAEDAGPIFYNAYRIGKNGKPFRMFKLRTMIVNAPDIRLADGSTYNGDNDPRITKIGKFLRKTSIDEIPQILNVLWGNMSFIGPRPDTLDWLEKYTAEERILLNVKPGITGYNQAYYRNSADGAAKLKNDIYYVQNISFPLDLKILFKTINTVLLQENINVDHSRI